MDRKLPTNETEEQMESGEGEQVSDQIQGSPEQTETSESDGSLYIPCTSDEASSDEGEGGEKEQRQKSTP